MATQIDEARSGRCTEALQRVAQVEQWAVADLQRLVADGRAVIPANRNRPVAQPAGIGRALCVKINANLGNSHLAGTPAAELEKLETALRHGADAVMDLSTGPALNDIRRAILARAPVPVGTVPIYEVATAVDDPLDLTPELILQVVDAQAREGVDFMTVHAGLLRDHLPAARRRRCPR
jgi:phosphomethylpyrimidine synthase